MFVTPICRNEYNYKTPFSGNFRMVMNKAGDDVLYKTFTYTFRSDFDWNSFPDFLYKKYLHTNKVTFIDHACSSGEETVSIVSKLMESLGDKAKKFFPILAKDFDEENIISAKKGLIYLAPGETEAIKRSLDNYENYFSMNKTGYLSVQTKPCVLSNINYDCSNILKDVDNFPETNTILFCRNIWLWLNPKDRQILIQKIANKFKDDSSLIAIGEADTESTEIIDLLHKNGFRQTDLWNVYSRSGN